MGENYPLKEVLLIKNRKLDEAEKVLKEKKLLLAKEEEKLTACQKEFDSAKKIRDAKLQQLRDTLDAGSTTDKIQQMKQYLKIVEEKMMQKEQKLKEQKKQVEIAKNNVEAARLDYLDKQKDVEKIKLHHTEWSKDLEKEELRKEAIVEEEIGTSGFVKKKQKKPSS